MPTLVDKEKPCFAIAFNSWLGNLTLVKFLSWPISSSVYQSHCFHEHAVINVVLVDFLLRVISYHMSSNIRKPVFGVSKQVLHKPGCTNTKDG